MEATITNNPSYLHPKVNNILQNFTKYVSKPLGLDKPMSEDKARHGEMKWFSFKIYLIIIVFFF